mgnify:FL=1
MPLFYINYKFVSMKKINLFLLILLTASCSPDDGGSITPPDGGGSGGSGSQTDLPSNLVVILDLQGQNSENPDGDGSGVFNLTATADNAVSFGFKVDTADEVQNSSGNFTYTVNSQGINQFPVTIYAYSSTEERISKIKNITIFVEQDNNGGSGNNDQLVWFDEFDGNGTINTNNWNYETGGGGWGNQEVQNYTNSSNNIYKENGILKIKVIKESNNTYTSARITTKNKFDFKYGRVDIRAKLPSLAGTWPALWMLGANIDSVSWPSCGEIDIMEQFEDKSYVQSTCHWQSSSTTDYAPVSYGLPVDLNTPTEFHVYSLIWAEGSVKTLLDGNQFYAMNTNSNMPFDANFFFIFNVAMGGTNGGTIDPNFTNDAMEVDYIRVYQ